MGVEIRTPSSKLMRCASTGSLLPETGLPQLMWAEFGVQLCADVCFGGTVDVQAASDPETSTTRTAPNTRPPVRSNLILNI
jgi:hypothetical protein